MVNKLANAKKQVFFRGKKIQVNFVVIVFFLHYNNMIKVLYVKESVVLSIILYIYYVYYAHKICLKII